MSITSVNANMNTPTAPAAGAGKFSDALNASASGEMQIAQGYPGLTLPASNPKLDAISNAINAAGFIGTILNKNRLESDLRSTLPNAINKLEGAPEGSVVRIDIQMSSDGSTYLGMSAGKAEPAAIYRGGGADNLNAPGQQTVSFFIHNSKNSSPNIGGDPVASLKDARELLRALNR
ncbi:hypothetical protein [Parasulfitobacter algicola]|uniref:Uncharacterized protein n=1 Tax=Parasulfitobacter algicola TaxID=2614809 RepID=A0ABX2IV39_9RHOB|nr:hypothetical protein [Sulfitobacter algicola]NSX56777.1 hypothetical protein [Sulfitobacter algicola]